MQSSLRRSNFDLEVLWDYFTILLVMVDFKGVFREFFGFPDSP